MANKAPHLHSSTRKMANNYLSGLSKKYHREIPISESINTLKDKFGIVVLQEAGTEWSGILVGPEGSMNLPLAPFNTTIGTDVPPAPDKIYPPYNNSVLAFQWYQVDNGNY